jgi:hypothetical protein
MTPERLYRELHLALDRMLQEDREIKVSSVRDGWVTVEHRGRRRHYPLTPEIGVLLCGDVRRGAFD